MKKIFVTAIFALWMICSVLPVNADSQPPAGQEKTGLTKEQVETLRGQLQGLRDVFGIETQNPQAQSKQPAQKKTIAEVADKGLDIVKQWVADAAFTLSNVAPDVWRVMMKQQYAKAIADLIGPWGTFLLVLVYIAVMRKKWVVTKDREIKIDSSTKINLSTLRTWCVHVIPICILSLSALFGLSYLSSSLKLLINPEFYAIRDLILILLGKG